MLALRCRSLASADVPPNLSMMSAAVMPPCFAENGSRCQVIFAAFANASGCGIRQNDDVLDTQELIARLEARGVKNREVARVLGINDSRVTEIKKGQRSVKLDEAAKLVKEFRLDEGPKLVPLPPAIWRLVGHHIVATLGLSLEQDDPRLTELLADLEAFSRFVSDPQVRESIEAAEGFFRAMQLRPGAAVRGRSENDPQHIR